jgi:hypothetical protein
VRVLLGTPPQALDVVMDTGSYMFAVRCDSGPRTIISSDVRVHLGPNEAGPTAKHRAGEPAPNLVLDTVLPAALFVVGSLAGVVIAYKEW